MARSQRTKIVLKDLGEPSAIKMLPETVRSMVLGTIGGTCVGFVERKSPDGADVYEGLAGQFRSIPADPEKDELESGVIFLPDAFHSMIAGPLKSMLMKDANAQLSFIFEVVVVRANNPQGYSWEFRPKIEAAAENPLDRLFEEHGGVKVIEGKRVLAIAAPKAKETAAAGKK